LNDNNLPLINFYRWLARGLTIPDNLTFSSDNFYGARSEFNELVRARKHGSRRAAELFYFLNRTCYNGLCRFNKQGEFNTPVGRYVEPKIARDLSPYSPYLQDWTFASGDFAGLSLEKKDFVFYDPPYDGGFADYGRRSFSWSDQQRVAQTASTHAGPVLLTNHATDRIVKLYKDSFDHIVLFESPRLIAANGKRHHTQEVMAVSNMDIPDSVGGTVLG
jgi:DNA adenine methylase